MSLEDIICVEPLFTPSTHYTIDFGPPINTLECGVHCKYGFWFLYFSPSEKQTFDTFISTIAVISLTLSILMCFHHVFSLTPNIENSANQPQSQIQSISAINPNIFTHWKRWFRHFNSKSFIFHVPYFVNFGCILVSTAQLLSKIVGYNAVLCTSQDDFAQPYNLPNGSQSYWCVFDANLVFFGLNLISLYQLSLAMTVCTKIWRPFWKIPKPWILHSIIIFIAIVLNIIMNVDQVIYSVPIIEMCLVGRTKFQILVYNGIPIAICGGSAFIFVTLAVYKLYAQLRAGRNSTMYHFLIRYIIYGFVTTCYTIIYSTVAIILGMTADESRELYAEWSSCALGKISVNRDMFECSISPKITRLKPLYFMLATLIIIPVIGGWILAFTARNLRFWAENVKACFSGNVCKKLSAVINESNDIDKNSMFTITEEDANSSSELESAVVIGDNEVMSIEEENNE